MTVVAIHQPDFLPYPGFFAKMSRADIFILYDTAQFSKNGFHNRNRIKTPNGPAWISVPVRAPRFQPVRSVAIENSGRWGPRLWRTLEASYRKAKYFDVHSEQLSRILARSHWERLADLNRALLDWARECLDIRTPLVLASSLPPTRATDATGRLLEMTGEVGGDVYLSGSGGRDYLDVSKFDDVALEFVDSKDTTYPQLWGAFVSRLSIVDAILNCGPDSQTLL